MANPEHVEIVKQGAEAIAEWRKRNPGVRLNLSKADLRRADLSRLDLSDADLSDADLRAAEMRWTVLCRGNLSEAGLVEAKLVQTDLRHADLSNARLTGASLVATNLHGAVLREARIGWTAFSDVDLSVAMELETVKHVGPSTVGVDTLYRSKGKIPEAFLCGCGVSDELIAYLPSLFGSQQAIQFHSASNSHSHENKQAQFYSCFISYSHKDEEFAKRLYSRMRDEKLRVWYPPEDMKGGYKLHEQIEDAIRRYDKLLLILSDHSMTSEWVATEIHHARQREVDEGKQVLFPIRLVPYEDIRKWKCFDAETGKDMGREIREYFIPNFSNWKDHDAFEAGFKRLLDDLKAEADRKDGRHGGSQK